MLFSVGVTVEIVVIAIGCDDDGGLRGKRGARHLFDPPPLNPTKARFIYEIVRESAHT